MERALQQHQLRRLITLAMLEETWTDIALINGGSICASIPAGEITKGLKVVIFPFGNCGVTTTTTGKDPISARNTAFVCGTGDCPNMP